MVGLEETEGKPNCSYYNFPRRVSGGAGADHCSLLTSGRTGGNGVKLHLKKFCLDTRKRFFTEEVVNPWNSLPWKVIVAPSLSEFKKCLENTHGHKI